MTTEEWNKVASLYFKIIELPEQEQVAYLKQIEKAHPTIIEEVKQMMREDQLLHPALQTGKGLTDFFINEDKALLNSRLGNYQLTQYLGGGGMGSVFLAEQADGELERKVALKLIRSTNKKPIALERFRQERQILSGLKHPNIAYLYEGGTTPEGRMFFTMEYIEGTTLDVYLQNNNLSLKDKLAIYEQVLAAIDYAHSQMVLHLDIKPGNILIEKDGQVKMVDFGVSKLLGNTASDTNSKTPYTLAFAAPEQIQNQPTSTATDIYALGGLLYKLLTGHLPFNRTSTAVSTLTAQLASEKLSLTDFNDFTKNTNYHPDYFHICQKALQLQPKERYRSVEQLRADIIAAQNNYPISLRKDEALYVTNRFIKRHLLPITAAATFLFSLGGMGLFYTFQLQKERNIAIKEASKSKQLVGLMTDMFASADPYVSQNDTLPVSHFLEQADGNLEKHLEKEPDLYAEMSLLLGSVYNGLGNYDAADSLIDKSLTVYKNSPIQDKKGLANAYQAKADIEYSLGEYTKGDSLYQLALSTYAQIEKPMHEAKGNCYLSLGHINIELGQYTTADSFLILAQQNFEKVLTSPHIDLASAIHARGDVARKQRNFEQSAIYYQAALSMQEALFEAPNTEIAYTLNHLASLHYDQFQYAKGIPFAEASYQQRKAIFGAAHVETIASQSNLSRLLSGTGDFEKAMEHKMAIYDNLLTIFGSHLHPYVLGTEASIASLYAQMENWQKSADTYKKVIDRLPQLSNPYPVLYVPYQGYGIALNNLGQQAAAEKNLRKALAVLPTSTRILPTGPISVRYDLAVCLYDGNKKEEAKNLMAEAKALLTEYPDFPKKRISRMEEILEE